MAERMSLFTNRWSTMRTRILVAAILAFAGPAAAQDPSRVNPFEDRDSDASPYRYLGLSSCSASNCHGGGRRVEGMAFSSYVHWWQRDTAHRDAYKLLRNELSESIVQRLNVGSGQAAVKAYEDRRCLVCHATGVDDRPSLAGIDEQHPVRHRFDAAELAAFSGNRFQISDGVQCEACHGPAEKWIGLHTDPAWLDSRRGDHWSSERKFNETGFLPLDDISMRSRVCGKCHVGGNGRDMNHDMIAAGHPRLDFEFATFHARLPVHWDRRQDAVRVTGMHPDSSQSELEARFEAQAWLIGQLGSAIQSLELLEYRARDANRSWPEFAEYSCYSCHHSLSAPSWRQRRGSSGLYPWGEWYFSMTPLVNELVRKPQATVAGQRLESLRSIMAMPLPVRLESRQSAGDLRRELQVVARELNARMRETGPESRITSEDLAGLLRVAAGMTDDLDNKGWDYAAQLYLAMVALRLQAPDAARQQLTQDEFDQRLSQVRETLLFRSESDQPGGTLNSPQRWRGSVGAMNDTLSRHPDLRIWDELRKGLGAND